MSKSGIHYKPSSEGAKSFANHTDAMKRRGAETFIPGLKDRFYLGHNDSG